MHISDWLNDMCKVQYGGRPECSFGSLRRSGLPNMRGAGLHDCFFTASPALLMSCALPLTSYRSEIKDSACLYLPNKTAVGVTADYPSGCRTSHTDS
jgi:hypothetical protein